MGFIEVDDEWHDEIRRRAREQGKTDGEFVADLFVEKYGAPRRPEPDAADPDEELR